MPWIVRHARFRDRLSAYVDGELTPREAGSLEAHLSACDSCGRELAGLRTTALALRELPDENAPRSFALTPAQAAPPAPRPVAAPGLVTGVRIAGAAMAAALAIVLVIDRADIGGENGEPSASRVQEAASLAMGSPEAKMYIQSGPLDLDSQRAAAGENAGAAAPASPGASPGLNYPATGADTAGPGVSATSAPLPLTGGGLGGVSGVPGSSAQSTAPPPEAAQESTSDKTAEAPLPSGAAAARNADLYQEPSGLSMGTPPALSVATAVEQSKGGGLSGLGLLEIALAALLGLTIGGSAVLPLFRKKQVS